MIEKQTAFAERLVHDDDWITVWWRDGTQSRFPAIWLRHNVPGGRA